MVPWYLGCQTCELGVGVRARNVAYLDKYSVINSHRSECASGMEQRPNYAAFKVVRICLGKVDCAEGMEQRPNHAVLKDAQTMLSEEECVTGMGRRKKSAAVKDARIKFKGEEFARGMEQISNVIF